MNDACLTCPSGVQPAKVIHEPFISNNASRLDRLWRWPRYYAASHLANGPAGRLTTAFQLVVRAADDQADWHGNACLRFPASGNANVRSAFVWFLISAPRAVLLAYGVEDQFVVMPLLLDTAVQISL